jgi:hypothetical protein
MSDLLVEVTNDAVPMVVTLIKDGALTGASPTVALRDGATTNSYLDWSDFTFKTSGWTEQFAPLGEIGNGQYQYVLDLTAVLGLTAGRALVAEYAVVDGGSTWTGHDVFLLIDTGATSALLRKLATNRLEEAPGNPGSITLYDDDGVTSLLVWHLRDASGGAIVSSVGAPARRSQAT